MKNIAYPYWVFQIWCEGAARIQCAQDEDCGGTIGQAWMRITGQVLQFMFGWWKWR